MSKEFVDTIIYASIVVDPNNEPTPVRYKHALIIDEGLLIDVLPYEKTMQVYQAAEEIYLDHHAVMPGLINAHGHAAMSLLRGYADDYELDTWLNEHIWPAENAHVSASFVSLGTELAAAEMIKTGTTTFSDMYFFPEAAAEVVDRVGLRAQFATTIFDFPCAWGSGPDDYLEKALGFTSNYANHPRVTIALGPHAPYTVNDENFAKVVAVAQEHELPIHVHLSETQKEVDDSIAQHGMSPVARLHKLGAIKANSQLVHMTALSEEDMALVAESGASVIHCPKSNLKLASGLCPTQALLNHGVNVAIGTDGAASNNALDQFSELQYAAMIAKVQQADPTAISALTALKMATIGGARALGIDHIVGDFTTGKHADLCAVRIDAIELQPLHNIISQLVYTQSGQKVTDVWVKGHRLLNDTKLTTIDEDALATRVAKFKTQMSTN